MQHMRAWRVREYGVLDVQSMLGILCTPYHGGLAALRVRKQVLGLDL